MGCDNKRSVPLNSTFKKSRLVPWVTDGDHKLFKVSSKRVLSLYSALHHGAGTTGYCCYKEQRLSCLNCLQLMAVCRERWWKDGVMPQAHTLKLIICYIPVLCCRYKHFVEELMVASMTIMPSSFDEPLHWADCGTHKVILPNANCQELGVCITPVSQDCSGGCWYEHLMVYEINVLGRHGAALLYLIPKGATGNTAFPHPLCSYTGSNFSHAWWRQKFFYHVWYWDSTMPCFFYKCFNIYSSYIHIQMFWAGRTHSIMLGSRWRGSKNQTSFGLYLVLALLQAQTAHY